MKSTFRNNMSHSRTKQVLMGYLWAAPFLIGIVVFLVLPFGEMVFQTVGMSGIKKYLQVYQSKAFANAVKNSLILLVVSLILIHSISFLLALFLEALAERGKLLLGIGILPYLVPAIGGVMFAQALVPDSLWSLVIIYLWKYTGFFALLLYSAIQKIPKMYYEAAALEGAGYWQRVRIVTWSCIQEMRGFSMILAVVYQFLIYREALLLGGTHPSSDLYLLQHYFGNNFENMNYLHLTAASVFVVGMTAGAVVLVFAVSKYRGRWEERHRDGKKNRGYFGGRKGRKR